MTYALWFLFLTNSQGLPPGLLESVCYVESNYKVTAFHRHDGHGNSVGVCQVKLKTAKWLGFKGSEKELMKPENNVKYAAMYLRYTMKRYDNDTVKAVIAYNMGHAGVLTHTVYSDKVLKKWLEYPIRNIASDNF